nr:hypothetical protein [Tanacetum cinerariifolium]
MACEEYSQEVIGFSDMIASGNLTPHYDPIVSTTSPTLTPFKNSDFLLEEVDAFLPLEDDPTSPEVDQFYVDTEGNILILEAFLNDDPSLPLQIKEITCPKFERNLKSVKLKPKNLQLMNLPRLNSKTYLPILNTHFWKEKSHVMVKEGIVLGYKISKNGIEVDKANVDVIAKLPHPTIVKGIRSFLGHTGFYRRKLTKAPILIALDWDMPFELICDASDFDIGAVLGQCQEKHFRPIHYASKTMTEAESNYTTTEKEMLAVVYCYK